MNTGRSSFRTCGLTAALIGGIRTVDWWLHMGIAVLMLFAGPSRSRADDATTDKKAFQVLDAFMTAFNAGDRKKQAATFNFVISNDFMTPSERVATDAEIAPADKVFPAAMTVAAFAND